MSVQVKGSGTIGGLDEGLVVSGIVTSSTEINVGSNIKIGSAGVVTATTFSGSGASLTNLPAANLTGTLPAISGANLTGITQTTINNNANNRVITGSGTANTLEGESTLTYADPILQIDTTSSYGTLKLDGSAGGLIEFNDDGTREWEIYGNAAQLQIYDRSNTNYHTKFKGGGNLEITNGNLVLASGHGIDFSATSGSPSNGGEILDDYEEGNFTPSLGGISNYGSYNVTGTGHYVKIGKVVHLNINFGNVDLNNSASGRVMIYNLPFAPYIRNPDCRGVTSNYMSHKVQHANDGMIHSWYIEDTYGSFTGQITKNNTSWTSWDASNFTQTGVYIDFSATYFTAS